MRIARRIARHVSAPCLTFALLCTSGCAGLESSELSQTLWGLVRKEVHDAAGIDEPEATQPTAPRSEKAAPSTRTEPAMSKVDEVTEMYTRLLELSRQGSARTVPVAAR